MTLSKEYDNLKSLHKSHKDINEENFRSLFVSTSCLLMTTVLFFQLLLVIPRKTLSNRQSWWPGTLMSNGGGVEVSDHKDGDS